VEKRLGRPIIWQKVPGGREICEKQLFHFIDTVERVEINETEMESFLQNVFKKLSWMTREELIKRFVSVEFNRFLDYYKDIPDLDNVRATDTTKERKDKSQFSFTTFRLNIGHAQGLTKRELMRYINGLRVSRGIEIGQITIFGDHCLIDLDSRLESKVKNAMLKAPYKGIQLTVSIDKTGIGKKQNKKPFKKFRK